MNELLYEVLTKAGFKAYYVARATDKEPCVVYNYISRSYSFADNELESLEYTVLLNLFVHGDIESTQNKLREIMLKAGFRLIETQKVNLENGMFNTAFKFKKILEVKRGY